jgi:hypothetical protein
VISVVVATTTAAAGNFLLVQKTAPEMGRFFITSF